MTSLDYSLEQRPGQRVRGLYLSDGKRPIRDIRHSKTLLPHPGSRFAVYFAKLDQLATDRTLLVEGSEPPSAATLAIARAALQQLEIESFEPTRVVASAEGGVGICFVDGDKYADIECFNSGGVLGVVSNRRDRPTTWTIEPDATGFTQAAARIRDFFGAAAITHDSSR